MDTYHWFPSTYFYFRVKSSSLQRLGICYNEKRTVLPAKSDSDVVFCLQLFSKTLTCTLHLSSCESIDHLCVKPILRIGLIHMYVIYRF